MILLLVIYDYHLLKEESGYCKNRRHFLKSTLTLGAGALVLASIGCNKKTIKSENYFTVAKRNGRYWLVTPDKEYTFSIGLNHVDPAAIRYLASGGVWDDKFENNMEKWLGKVKQDLTEWGFDCVGWEQEVVIIHDEMHRHSRSFTYEEYQWLDMPYFNMLPVIESHQWEWETKLPDITGSPVPSEIGISDGGCIISFYRASLMPGCSSPGKVKIEWMLSCMVHNLEKLLHFGGRLSFNTQ